ncbi:MAG: hypothetical protein JO251_02255 [Verrucomicrobia bacterium]|nr:hypothetical protein [Verrucomicrobiota bacterium]
MPRIVKNFLKKHLLRDLPAKQVRRWVDRELGANTVLGGPFRNMKYNNWTRLSGLAKASAYYPKLLGTYEIEIVPFIQRIAELGMRRIIVVGAGEGYYAVGFARLLNAQVVAFEAQGTEALLELAALNGVSSHVSARTICDAAGLRAEVDGRYRTCVFMDIEGGESILLDPLIVPGLSAAWMIVEVHDCFIPGTTLLLRRRFELSHRIQEVWSRPRCPEDFPLQYRAKWFDPSMYYLEYMGERPVTTSWLYMEPINQEKD